MRKKNREPNGEILRCFLMFCIVLGHACCHGPYEQSKLALILNNLTCFCVPAFVLISGWYGIRFSWMRLIRFVGYGAFASVFLFIAGICVYGSYDFVFSMGWFGLSYIGLMVIAPIVNAAIESLNKEGKVFGVWAAYTFVVWGCWLHWESFNINLRPIGWGGHTFNTLVYIYVTGRCMSLFKDRLFAFRLPALIATITILEIVNIAGLSLGRCFRGNCVADFLFGGKVSDYQSPIMLLLAACVFLIFFKIKWPQMIGRIALFLGQSMFMVYLLHDGTNSKIARDIFSLIEIRFGMLGGIAIAALLVFTGCVFIDLIRRYFIKCVCLIADGCQKCLRVF